MVVPAFGANEAFLRDDTLKGVGQAKHLEAVLKLLGGMRPGTVESVAAHARTWERNIAQVWIRVGDSTQFIHDPRSPNQAGSYH